MVLLSARDLQAWEPDSEAHPTYGDDKRLDWILASTELALVRHETLEETVSDHRPVWAQLRWRPPREEENLAPTAH